MERSPCRAFLLFPFLSAATSFLDLPAPPQAVGAAVLRFNKNFVVLELNGQFAPPEAEGSW